jgi:hypothetical protein
LFFHWLAKLLNLPRSNVSNFLLFKDEREFSQSLEVLFTNCNTYFSGDDVMSRCYCITSLARSFSRHKVRDLNEHLRIFVKHALIQPLFRRRASFGNPFKEFGQQTSCVIIAYLQSNFLVHARFWPALLILRVLSDDMIARLH